MIDQEIRTVAANGIEIETAITGAGPDLVLLHGFPHTRRLWDMVTPALARDRRVIAPDLRGLGGTTRAASGYDVVTLSRDLIGLLDAVGSSTADVVGIDAGAPPAFVAALQHPGRVRRLVMIESTLGTMPGAEAFFASGPPWWFGFHQVPGLAETVLEGHEAEYLRFFYRIGTASGAGIDPDIERAFIDAYHGRESLRCGFEHYRAMTESSRQLAELTAHRRLAVPTLAIGAQPVGAALLHQLQHLADDLRGEQIDRCGHLVPLDRPDALVALLDDFLDSTP